MADPADSPCRAVRLVVPVLAFVAAFGLSVFQIHNDDLGFHVATGRWIRATGTVPDRNPFTFSGDDTTWTQHQWLPAVAFSWVVDEGGAKAIILLKATLVGLCFLVVALSLRRSQAPAGLAAFLVAAAIGAAANRFYERPDLLSEIALAGVSAALLAWRRAGCGRSWLPWAALAATVVAVHLHAGGLYALLVWLALAAGVVAGPALPVRVAAVGPHAARVRPLAFAAGTAAAVALTLWLFAPSGLAVLGIPFSFATDPWYNEHLVEFRPLALAPELAFQWLAVGVAAAGVGLAVARRRLFELFLLVGFGYLGVAHLRMIWPLAIVATVAVGALVGGAPLRERLAARRWQVLFAGAAVLVLLATTLEQQERYRMGLGEDGIDRRHHPVELIDRAGELPPEAFVSDGLAGFWLWRNFRPGERERRVLVHNCLECYRPATYVGVYQSIRYGEPGWQETLARLGVRTLLLKHTSAGERRFQQGRPNLRDQVFLDDRWRLADFDDVAALWVAADAAPPAASAPFPVDPDTGRLRPGATYTEARTALRAHAAAHPGATRSLLLLGHLARQTGDRATLAAAVKEVLARDPGNALALEWLGTLAGR